jgi:HTH-type transcriptional regulator/antitoxin MqsA
VTSSRDGNLEKCPLCGGGLEDRRITHAQHYGERIIILENVPAEVCRQCGEVLLRPGVLERIQDLVWSEGTPKRIAQVPVYDLAEIE